MLPDDNTDIQLIKWLNIVLHEKPTDSLQTAKGQITNPIKTVLEPTGPQVTGGLPIWMIVSRVKVGQVGQSQIGWIFKSITNVSYC